MTGVRLQPNHHLNLQQQQNTHDINHKTKTNGLQIDAIVIITVISVSLYQLLAWYLVSCL